MTSSNKTLTICYCTFGLIGLVFSMRTNVFQFVQQDYLDGYNHIANLVLISGICMQISLFLSGYLIDRFGYKYMLAAGIAFYALPTLSMQLVNSALTFDIAYTLTMFGYGITVLVLNLFVCYLAPERKGNVLLTMHLFFAMGALGGPKLITWLMSRGLSWQNVLALSGLPFTAVLIYSLLLKDRYIIHRHSTATNGGESVKSIMLSPLIWLLAIVFMCTQTWEYGMGTWFVIFAAETRKISASEAAFYLTIFYGAYPLFRVVFSRIIHRMNLYAVLFISFISCTLLVISGAVSGLLIFYSLTGLGVSLMYPAFMALIQDIKGAHTTKRIGFITMAGGLIQYLALWGVGIISDRTSISTGFISLIIYLIAGALALLAVLLMQKKKSCLKA